MPVEDEAAPMAPEKDCVLHDYLTLGEHEVADMRQVLPVDAPSPIEAHLVGSRLNGKLQQQLAAPSGSRTRSDTT